MRVIWPYEQLQLVEHMSGERVLGQHALNGELQDFGWLLFPHTDRRDGSLAAWIASEPHVALLRHFGRVVRVFFVSHPAAGELHFVGIHDDHVVTGVDVWCVIRSVLAHQNRCQARCQPTDGHPGCVDDVPFRLMVATGATIGGLQKRCSRSNHNLNPKPDSLCEIR